MNTRRLGTAFTFSLFFLLAHGGCGGSSGSVSSDNAEQGCGHVSSAPEIDRTSAMALSRDGCFLVYDLAGQIHRRDRTTGEVSLVSATATGEPLAGSSRIVDVDATGRHVLFVSDAPDAVSSGVDGRTDRLYLRDVERKSTVHVLGVGDLSTAGEMALSSDGRWVAFVSSVPAAPPVGTTVERNEQVFLHHIEDGQTVLVSRAIGADHGGDGDSRDVDFSPDGMHLVFDSDAPDLIEGIRPSGRNAYRYGIESRHLEIVSLGVDGEPAGGFAPRASAGGRYVAFVSRSVERLAPTADQNDEADVFVRDMQNGTTTLASVDSSGARSATGASMFPRISADGRKVIFVSAAQDLIEPSADSNGAFDVYWRDLEHAETRLVSANEDGTAVAVSDLVGSPAQIVPCMSPNCRLPPIGLRGDRGGGAIQQSPAPGWVSADGLRVAFSTPAGGLVEGHPDPTGHDLFLRDMRSERVVVITASRPADHGPLYIRPVPRHYSDDGSVIVFCTTPAAENGPSGCSIQPVRPRG